MSNFLATSLTTFPKGNFSSLLYCTVNGLFPQVTYDLFLRAYGRSAVTSINIVVANSVD